MKTPQETALHYAQISIDKDRVGDAPTTPELIATVRALKMHGGVDKN